MRLPIPETDDLVLSTIEGEVLGSPAIDALLAYVETTPDVAAQLAADRERLQTELSSTAFVAPSLRVAAGDSGVAERAAARATTPGKLARRPTGKSALRMGPRTKSDATASQNVRPIDVLRKAWRRTHSVEKFGARPRSAGFQPAVSQVFQPAGRPKRSDVEESSAR